MLKVKGQARPIASPTFKSTLKFSKPPAPMYEFTLYLYIYIYTCIRVYKYIHIYVSMYLCIYRCVYYVYIYIYVYVYGYLGVCLQLPTFESRVPRNLRIAAFRGRLEIVRLLLASSADPDLADEGGRTALAATRGRHPEVRLLLAEVTSTEGSVTKRPRNG